jgi:hypothetical protein
MALLLMFVFMGAAVSHAQPPGEDVVIASPEIEPNDTMDQAVYIMPGFLHHGRINPPGDVDFYSFFPPLIEDLTYQVTLSKPPSSSLSPVLSLFAADGTLMQEATCIVELCLEFTLPAYDFYYLRVADGNSGGGNGYDYAFRLAIADLNEPNDFFSQATPYALGESVSSVFSPAGDIDNYVVELIEGQELLLTSQTMNVALVYGPDEEFLTVLRSNEGQVFKVEQTGSHYLQFFNQATGDLYTYQFSLNESYLPVYVSFNTAGTLGGIAFQPGDILRYNELDGSWQLAMDASALGLKGNLTAFALDEYWFMMAIARPQILPGIGGVMPQDVVAFMPVAPGDPANGELTLLFDGSDVGLSAVSEQIDALSSGQYASPLYISTKGAARVPTALDPIRAGSNDVLSFWLYSPGADTTGEWSIALDFDELNLGRAKITGLSINDYWVRYLSFDRAMTVGGVDLDRGDILRCTSYWDLPLCATAEKVWDASDAGIGGYQIDAIEIGDREIE